MVPVKVLVCARAAAELLEKLKVSEVGDAVTPGLIVIVNGSEMDGAKAGVVVDEIAMLPV